MIWILSLYVNIFIFEILAVYIDIEYTKNIHVLQILIKDLDNEEGSSLGFGTWSWFWYGHLSSIHPFSEFWFSILLLKVKRTSMYLKSWFGAFGDTGGSWLGVGIIILIWIWSLVLKYPCSEFWRSVWSFKLQRTSMSFKAWFGALEDAGGSWPRFGILILLWIWSLVCDTPMFQILALYVDFEAARNIHVL